MIKITTDHIEACRRIAAAIVAELIQGRGNVDMAKDFANGDLGAGVKVKVRLLPVGHFDEIRLIEGHNGIELAMPRQGLLRPPIGKEHLLELVRRVACGALVHELVHTIQKGYDLASFDVALKKSKEFRELADDQKTGERYLADYYAVPEEHEAHAIQAAAEVWHQHGLDFEREDFFEHLPSTEVFQRVRDRTAGSPTADVETWFARANEIAWAAYQGWK